MDYVSSYPPTVFIEGSDGEVGCVILQRAKDIAVVGLEAAMLDLAVEALADQQVGFVPPCKPHAQRPPT